MKLTVNRGGRPPLPDGAEKARLVSVSLYPHEIEQVKLVGDGSVTRGVRALLEQSVKKLDR